MVFSKTSSMQARRYDVVRWWVVALVPVLLVWSALVALGRGEVRNRKRAWRAERWRWERR